MFFLILILVSYKSDYFYYPIDEISIISKNKKYNQKVLNKYIDTLYEKNLLTINIDEIQETILSDIWIRDAEIVKSFPSKLNIKIIQHIPIAIYNSNIITSTGTLIESSHSYKHLPTVVDHSDNIKSASKILSFSLNNLEKTDLRVKKIIIYHSLIRIYASDILLITDKEKYKVNLKRLVTSFDKLHEIFNKKINSIDMRYSNGFAIK